MSEEYDLKKSENKIGQLYPILVAKDGKIIDGFHRKDADPNWKTLVVPEIDTEEKLLLARLIANFHRRQVTKQEKEEWINGLAKIYKAQGLRVFVTDNDGKSNEIKQKLVEVTGLNQSTVHEYLANEFKQELKGGGLTTIPASDKVERVLGKKGAEKYRKQVLAEANLSPQERAALTKKRQQEKEERERKREENKRIRDEKRKEHEEQIRKQAEESAKDKLLHDKQFIKDAAKMAPSIIDEETEETKSFRLEEVQKQSLERFLNDYAEALTKYPKQSKKDETTTFIHIIKSMLQKQKLHCPICNEEHVTWKCGHEF